MIPARLPIRIGRAAVHPLRSPRCCQHSTAPVSVKRVGVVGAGQMGGGIAIVSAQNAGLDVTVFDAFPESLEKNEALTDKLMQRAVDKGKLDESGRDGVLGRITRTSQLADLESADFIIEAATENVELKLKCVHTAHAPYRQCPPWGLGHDSRRAIAPPPLAWACLPGPA